MFNYNFIQKIFHEIVFSSKLINRFLFELEKLIYLKRNDFNKNKHIFITGLPRSGTTILLNSFYNSGEFASLKYSNMPFILSPNFSKLFSGKNIEKKERLHADNIMIDLNSPEAFDEVFFSSISDESKNIKSNLFNFINLILISQNKKKYLSKNNLNFKRINLIKSVLPNSIFLIPVREPLQHANSLQKQHLHFSNLQNKNIFIRKYMDYLGHCEFGLGHKPWNKPLKYKDATNMNYWLEQWFLFYKNIYEKFKNNPNCSFVIYESLSNKFYIKERIHNLTNSNLDVSIFKDSNKNKIDVQYDKSLYKNSLQVYENFIKHAY